MRRGRSYCCRSSKRVCERMRPDDWLSFIKTRYGLRRKPLSVLRLLPTRTTAPTSSICSIARTPLWKFSTPTSALQRNLSNAWQSWNWRWELRSSEAPLLPGLRTLGRGRNELPKCLYRDVGPCGSSRRRTCVLLESGTAPASTVLNSDCCRTTCSRDVSTGARERCAQINSCPTLTAAPAKHWREVCRGHAQAGARRTSCYRQCGC